MNNQIKKLKKSVKIYFLLLAIYFGAIVLFLLVNLIGIQDSSILFLFGIVIFIAGIGAMIATIYSSIVLPISVLRLKDDELAKSKHKH